MTTEKYDLHTIDYSVQGWDLILAADMEMLDAIIPTRIIITLGETVAAYESLYLNPDGKWYLAQADGALQPAHGLACEGGDADDEIRLHRMGEIENEAWAWAIIGGPVYLDPDTPGALTQERPADNIQIIGYALTATKIIVIPPQDSAVVRGSSGGLKRKIAEIQAAITADAEIEMTLSIPAGARLLGAQFRVDEALATGETWCAAYSGGSETALVIDAAVDQNTKMNVMHAAEITDDVTNITITKTGGGAFTAQGAITAIVYYEEFNEMESVT